MDRRAFIAAAGAAAAGATLPVPARAEELHPAIARLQTRAAPPPISEAERAQRRAALQRLMEASGVAAVFLEPGASLEYFGSIPWSRSERVFGLLVPRRGDAVVVSPAFEKQRAERQVRGRFQIFTWQEDESPYELIARKTRELGGASGTIAVDDSARVFVAHGIRAAGAPGLVAGDAAEILHRSRGVKSAHEIAIMRFANRITLEAYAAAFRTMRAGMTQRDLALNVSAAMQKLGYEGYALVLFGESSAYPHGAENPAPLKEGDVVLVDGGLSVHGYESDDTRTVTFGRPSAEAQRVFDVVQGAQRAALAAAKPGRPCGAVDDAARDFITRAGYGPDYRLFTHRLGHGIGLEGHEWPYLVRGSDIELRPGMTFSDEPGIYQYGKFGVRLEDIIAITGDGAEMLTEPATRLAFEG